MKKVLPKRSQVVTNIDKKLEGNTVATLIKLTLSYFIHFQL